MKRRLESLQAALAKAAAVSVKARLCRLVPQLDLGGAPDWLFTSGKPNRYNPRGVDCIYFSESAETAQAEHDSFWRRTAGESQPVTTFYAQVKLGRVLDLTDGATLKVLGIKKKDLSASWRRAKSPTLTQMLGREVSESRLFSAIRYPSEPAKTEGKEGCNLVIFKGNVKSPDQVEILGRGTSPLQKWP